MKNSIKNNREGVYRIRKAKMLFCRACKSEKGCKNCGEKDPIILEFHHPEGTSKHPSLKKNLSSFSRLGWEDLVNEIEKCEILCANCHRRISFLERQKHKRGEA